MGVAVTGAGHFQLPAAPSAGVSVVSGAANNYTGTAIVLTASSSAMLITGVFAELSAVSASTYGASVQLMSGAGGSETSIGQYYMAFTTGSTVALSFHDINPPIKVAASTRISVKVADSIGTKTYLVAIECVLTSNVVDDGTAVATVTTVTNQLTAAQVATGVWTDTVGSDFSTASSIGKTLYIANVAPGGSGGLMISGTNAGTTTLGALTVTGATTHTGNVVLSDGLTISAPSTGNRAGLDIAGNGTGAAIKATGGATGIGFSIIGGGTSGDGIKVTTTSGHGLNLAPVGTSMHGILSTGGNGGTSDGIKAAAGTGGVDIRGNITGTLTTVTTVSNQLTAAAIATGVWTDTTAGDFTAALSVGKSVMNGVTLGTGLTVNDITTKSGYSLAVTPPTAAAIATAVWTDTTGTDFTTALSVGKSVMNGVTLGTGLTVNDITTKTGYSLTQAFPTNFSSLGISAAGKINGVVLTDALTTYTGNTVQTGDAFARLGAAGAGLTALGDTRIANLDGTVTSRMATFVYTAPDNTSITAIKAKTDSLTYTVTGQVDANIQYVNDVLVTGVGTAGSPWGP